MCASCATDARSSKSSWKRPTDREALEAIAELAPDVLITDIRMPELDGLRLAREAYYNHPEMMIVIVSGYDDFAYAKSALQFGVKDYLLKPVNAEELQAAMARLLVQLDREYRAGAAPRAQEELVTLVQEHLRAHFGEEVSLAALAERFHVNLPYLTRLFKRTIGVAPVRYLRDLRITHARKLLQERPDLEIKEIGPMAGYPDPGYFSRIFRMSVGIGPQEYRERGNPGGGLGTTTPKKCSLKAKLRALTQGPSRWRLRRLFHPPWLS